jgi:spore maturation protein CgeB
MRFLLVSTDYADFLTWLYAQNPGLETSSYADQARARAQSLFSLADFYSRNLRQLGHEAWDVDVNNEHMQKAWAREHGVKVRDTRLGFRLRRGYVPWISRIRSAWQYEILAAQIRDYKPDVIINHATEISGTFLRERLPAETRLLIGSFASLLPQGFQIKAYDLVLSCVDNFVEYFRREGARSERLRFAFEPVVLKQLGQMDRSIPVSFVGNLYQDHGSRREWLEQVSMRAPIRAWGGWTNHFADDSPLKSCCEGPAWGVRMYEVLRRSLMTLNHHVDVAADYAGNIRLFEATGVGTLLISDWKKNLPEMFVPGKEIVVYRSPQECVDVIHYYLSHDAERAAIATAGQQRTLRDHNYFNRMQELVAIVTKYL